MQLRRRRYTVKRNQKMKRRLRRRR
jgi:hypothetical protein